MVAILTKKSCKAADTPIALKGSEVDSVARLLESFAKCARDLGVQKLDSLNAFPADEALHHFASLKDNSTLVRIDATSTHDRLSIYEIEENPGGPGTTAELQQLCELEPIFLRRYGDTISKQPIVVMSEKDSDYPDFQYLVDALGGSGRITFLGEIDWQAIKPGTTIHRGFNLNKHWSNLNCQKLFQLYEEGTIQNMIPPYSPTFSKRGLATLYDHPDVWRSAGMDMGLVEKHVPECHVFCEKYREDVLRNKDQWVVKNLSPDLSFRSKGVVVGKYTTLDKWKPSTAGFSVIQRYCQHGQLRILFQNEEVEVETLFRIFFIKDVQGHFKFAGGCVLGVPNTSDRGGTITGGIDEYRAALIAV